MICADPLFSRRDVTPRAGRASVYRRVVCSAGPTVGQPQMVASRSGRWTAIREALGSRQANAARILRED